MHHSSSNIRSAHKLRSYGRSLLKPSEKGLPWYCGSVWLARKNKIALRVAMQVQAARARRIAREERKLVTA